MRAGLYGTAMTMRSFGARWMGEDTTFRLWAPAASSVTLQLDAPVEMPRQDSGWFAATVPGVRPGTLYRYRIDGDIIVPDPASAFQPDDVFGPSEVIDHTAFVWHAEDWRGRPWHEAVILEAHVGTFTREGTYRAMIERLDHLVATGVTALELMPLNDFAGRRNWGYDGVLWYAPDSSYGRPEDLKTLIDEAHLRGLMVFLDVVYNHLGPEGNFLGRYAPEFFDETAHTPWGAAINYDLPQVRAFAIESALQWLRDYRFDGLRLDAVHAIDRSHRVQTDGALLLELNKAVGALAYREQREIHLVLENDANEASLLAPAIDPPDGQYRAQWNDDIHHAWHVLLTGEHGGYYGDYAQPLYNLHRALASGFSYQGEPSPHRDGAFRGEPSGAVSPLAFVNFLQNHDQIGNRALGDRLTSLALPEALEAALAVTLLSPMPPMLFMGEEWGSRQPFPFFCDFTGDLAEAVRQGRRREFEAAYARFGDAVPDPLAEATYAGAKLDWETCDTDTGRRRLGIVGELLRIRQRHLMPLLAEAAFVGSSDGTVADGPLTVRYRLARLHELVLVANLSDRPLAHRTDNAPGTWIWGGPPPETLRPWSVFWRLG